MKLAIRLNAGLYPASTTTAKDCMECVGKTLMVALGIPPEQVIVKLIEDDIRVNMGNWTFTRTKEDGAAVVFAVNMAYATDAKLRNATFMSICAMCTSAWTN